MAADPARRDPAPHHHADALFERLGVHITSETLERALTHRSFSYENGNVPTNERLEFLGDAILGFVVADHLFGAYPDLAEGDLARRRASVVSTRALAHVARELGVGQYIRLGAGERATGGADKDSILADTFEALLGSVYVDHGSVAAAGLVHRHIIPLLADERVAREGTDFKTIVAEAASRHDLGEVRYDIVGQGPAHAPRFEATLWVGQRAYRSAVASSKKQAERDAAAASWPDMEASLPTSTPS